MFFSQIISHDMVTVPTNVKVTYRSFKTALNITQNVINAYWIVFTCRLILRVLDKMQLNDQVIDQSFNLNGY